MKSESIYNTEFMVEQMLKKIDKIESDMTDNRRLMIEIAIRLQGATTDSDYAKAMRVSIESSINVLQGKRP